MSNIHGRLLDEDDVYEVLTEYYHHCMEIQHEALREALSRVPTAGKAKRGEWHVYIDDEDISNCICICSECGEVYCLEDFRYDDANYCPNCGVRTK